MKQEEGVAGTEGAENKKIKIKKKDWLRKHTLETQRKKDIDSEGKTGTQRGKTML